MQTVFDNDDFRVTILGPDIADPLSGEGRLLVMNRHTRAVLMRDGSWEPVVEGTAIPENAGYRFPLGALGQLGQAIEQYLGGATHARTEVAVLREWLAHEIARAAVVDQFVREAVMPPRFIDFAAPQPGIIIPERKAP